MEFYERVSGARMHAAYFKRWRGLRYRSCLLGLLDDIYSFCPLSFSSRIWTKWKSLLTNNRIWKYRLVSNMWRLLRKTQALNWGFSGVMLAQYRCYLGISVVQFPYEIYSTVSRSKSLVGVYMAIAMLAILFAYPGDASKFTH